MSTTAPKESQKKVDEADERINPRLSLNLATVTADPKAVVAAEFNPNDPNRSWDEIRAHAQSKFQGNEQIGAIIVQIIGKGAQESRFIDYSHPRDGHHISVNTGADIKKTDPLLIQHITIMNTGGPNTEYRYYNPPGIVVCQ